MAVSKNIEKILNALGRLKIGKSYTAPVEDNEAAPKKYVDDNFFNKSGDTVSGDTVLDGDVRMKNAVSGDDYFFDQSLGTHNFDGTALNWKGDQVATKNDANVAAQAFSSLKDAQRVAQGGVDGRNVALTTLVQQTCDPRGVTPIQICSLADNNVITIYKNGTDYNAVPKVIFKQFPGSKGSIHVLNGITPGAVITSTKGVTSVANNWGLQDAPLTGNFEGFADTLFFGYTFRDGENQNNIDYTTHTLEPGVVYPFLIDSLCSNTSDFTDDLIIVSEDAFDQIAADGLTGNGQTVLKVYTSGAVNDRSGQNFICANFYNETSSSATGDSLTNNGDGTMTLNTVAAHGLSGTNGRAIRITASDVGATSGSNYVGYFGVLDTPTANSVVLGGSSERDLNTTPLNVTETVNNVDWNGVKSIRTNTNDDVDYWGDGVTGTLEVEPPGFGVSVFDPWVSDTNDTGIYIITCGAVSATVTMYPGNSSTPVNNNGYIFEDVGGTFSATRLSDKLGLDPTNTPATYDLQPFETCAFFTKGDGEYRIEATNPVFVSTCADGGVDDVRILPPLSTEIIGHARSGYCSAVYPNTEVWWYGQDLTFGKFTCNPGSPNILFSFITNELGNCYQITSDSTPPTGGTFDLTLGSETATIPYNASGEEIVGALCDLMPNGPITTLSSAIVSFRRETFFYDAIDQGGGVTRFVTEQNADATAGDIIWLEFPEGSNYNTGAYTVNANTGGANLDIQVAYNGSAAGKQPAQVIYDNGAPHSLSGDEYIRITSTTNPSRIKTEVFPITHIIDANKLIFKAKYVDNNGSGNVTVDADIGYTVTANGVKVLIKNGVRLNEENIWCGIFHQNTIGNENANAVSSPTPSIGSVTQTFNGVNLTGGTYTHSLLQAVSTAAGDPHANMDNPLDYGISGFYILRANQPISAFSGADGAGTNTTPWYPVNILPQRVGLALGTRTNAGANGDETGFAIASPFRGNAKIYTDKGLYSPGDLTMYRGASDTDPATPWEQLFPCAFSIATDPANGYEDFKGGYIECDVPVYGVINSELQERVVENGIKTNDDETAFSGITPAEIKSKYEIHYDEEGGFAYKVSFKGGQWVTKKL